MSQHQKYDFIIAGAGCAGLSLLIHMIESGQFSNRRILLIDKDRKNKNDRTWCFWESKPGPFESIVYSRWGKAWFHQDQFSRLMNLAPYEYKLIRGIDFYSYCFDIIEKYSNIEIRYGAIDEIGNEDDKSFVVVDGQRIFAEWLFNSLPSKRTTTLNRNEYRLLQHFKGWVIETGAPAFEPAEATLMDFRTKQAQGTSFVYVMPFASNRALIEYTLFTESLLEPAQYDAGLKDYVANVLNINDYKITEEEFGIIPMTNARFPVQEGNIIYIGTAGGQTKASSGYTFRFIQKHSAALVAQLVQHGTAFLPANKTARKFRFYDSVLLHILYNRRLEGKDVFTDLFRKNKPQDVLRFLDNETSLKDDLKIIRSLPTMPFLKAAIRQL